MFKRFAIFICSDKVTQDLISCKYLRFFYYENKSKNRYDGGVRRSFAG